MMENIQVDVQQNRQVVFVRCCLKVIPHRDCCADLPYMLLNEEVKNEIHTGKLQNPEKNGNSQGNVQLHN
jgi:hypothetical protein